MSVLALFTPTSVTVQQYDESIRRLEQGGDWPPDGLDVHVCFGPDDNIRVSEIWDSHEQFEAFSERLMHQVVGAFEWMEATGGPELLTVHNIIRR